MLPDNGCKIRFWWLLMQLPYTFGECDLVNTKCENACHYGLYCCALFSRPVAEPTSFLAHEGAPSKLRLGVDFVDAHSMQIYCFPQPHCDV